MGQFKVGSCLANPSKMQFLVVLLSASLVYGATNPGGHHFGHAYHDGPHCHDQKDYQCHKTPKQQNHEECYVDYDIIVDVTEIEECEYVVITHCAEEHEQVYHNSHIVKGESEVVDAHQKGYGYGNGNYVKREAGNQGYSSGPYCQDKKEQQCHKHPKENTRKIPKQTCKNIVDTIYIETCEERIHTQCEETHERVTTALVLLLMILKLLLLHHILDTRPFMGVAIRICFLCLFCLLNKIPRIY